MTAQKLQVTLHDGTEHIITPTLQDTLAFETTLRKNPGWGNLAESLQRQWAFKAWNYLKRTGVIDQTWLEFTDGEHAAIEATIYHEPDPEPEPAGDPDDDAIEAHVSGKSGTKARSTAPSSPSPSAPTSSPQPGEESTPTT